MSALIIAIISVLSGVMLRYGINVTPYDGLCKGLSAGLSWGLNMGKAHGLYIFVTGVVVIWALSGGFTVLRHYMIRWLLALHHTFPWRAQIFLDDATMRILLQREGEGGGYRFFHRRLQDYFAETALLPTEETSKARKEQ
jgi:hypothetical protein